MTGVALPVYILPVRAFNAIDLNCACGGGPPCCARATDMNKWTNPLPLPGIVGGAMSVATAAYCRWIRRSRRAPRGAKRAECRPSRFRIGPRHCARPFHLLNSNAFVTTLTLENAIAAPAMTGFSKPNAASGTPTRLYTNAQNRFCWIFR